MLDMKVGEKPESLYIIGCLLELIIKICQFEFSSSSAKFRPIFQWKILWTTWNHIFQVEILRNFAPKKTLNHPQIYLAKFDNIQTIKVKNPSYFWQNGLNSPKRSVLPTRHPLVTLSTKRQGGTIWSTCQCYFVILWRLHTCTTNQKWSILVIAFISYCNSIFCKLLIRLDKIVAVLFCSSKAGFLLKNSSSMCTG
jgi:hypothetical protein